MALSGDTNLSPAGRSETSADLDWEKWKTDIIFRERELELKTLEQARLDKELKLRIDQDRRSRWTSPLVIAILGAAVAAAGNAGISWFNANSTREIQQNTALASLQIERMRGEANRILEAVKTQGDPDKAAANLQFLLDVKLIVDREVADATRTYLSNRQGGAGISLTSAIPIAPGTPSPP